MTSVLCVMGPTASGKTALAAHLSANLPVTLVSVDSAQVYRGMDIGTAKPDAALPHRLVDIVDPDEPYSAARFRADALREIADIAADGQVPVLVGGTMLYFRALFRGIAAMPAADAEVRAKIEAEAQSHGWAALHAELATVDAEAAARIKPTDPQRIQRALEVYRLTGTPISELQRETTHDDGNVGLQFHKLAVAPHDRAVLHRRIESRFNAMMDAGLVDEVRALCSRYPGADLPALRAVGYRQILAALDGRMSMDDAVDRAVVASRQLAKRQLTWLRAEPDLVWIDPEQTDWLDRGLDWARNVLC